MRSVVSVEFVGAFQLGVNKLCARMPSGERTVRAAQSEQSFVKIEGGHCIGENKGKFCIREG